MRHDCFEIFYTDGDVELILHLEYIKALCVDGD